MVTTVVRPRVELAPPPRDHGAAEGRGERPDVSVVLPCLDEVESVGLCVDEALTAAKNAGLRAEVIVVDNGSTDGSRNVAIAAGATVITETRRGYGSALRTGIACARAPIVVMADADLTYPLCRLADLISPIREGRADLVVGSRLDDATRATMPVLHRYLGTPTLSFLVSRACDGVAVNDSQSGLRAFRSDVVLDLGLQATGMEFASEMLIRAANAGLRIEEVSTGYRSRVGTSKLNTFADGWRHLQLICCLAPHIVLFLPGVALLGLGLASIILMLAFPTGVDIGSLRWQPMFFSTILLVLGTLALLGGSAVAHASVLTSPATRQRYGFVGRPRFPARCVTTGLVALAIGLAIDAALCLNWALGRTAPSRGHAFAALAQALLIAGAIVAALGLIWRLQQQRVSYEWAVSPQRARSYLAPDMRWTPAWAERPQSEPVVTAADRTA